MTNFEAGNSFLLAAKTRVPICVFLDVVMPRRSGLEILQEFAGGVIRCRSFSPPPGMISRRWSRR